MGFTTKKRIVTQFKSVPTIDTADIIRDLIKIIWTKNF